VKREAEPAGIAETAAATPRHPTCESCGRERSDVALGDNGAHVCARCRRVHAFIAAAHSVLSTLAFVFVLFYLMPHLVASVAPAHVLAPLISERAARQRSIGVQMLVFYLSLVLAVPVHEGAHALCARALGFTVTQVDIGSGRVVFKRKLAGTTVVVRAVPLGGMTRWKGGAASVTPAKRAAVAFAGPLSNLLLAGACWAAHPYAPYIAIPAACANLLTFAVNILPAPHSPWSKTANDGWQILTNLGKSHAATSAARAGC